MKLTVLCYGDSNTHGYDPYTGGRYPYAKRWTTLLGDMLGDGYTVIPEGLNGRTTSFDKPGMAYKNGRRMLIGCLESHKPVDIIIIMLGTNDCIVPLGLSPHQIADGLESLLNEIENVARSIQGYIPTMIVAAPPVIRGDYTNSPFGFELDGDSLRKSLEIVPLFRDAARRHGALFADASEMEVADDCEHLTEKGHRQIAELFYKKIVESYINGGEQTNV